MTPIYFLFPPFVNRNLRTIMRLLFSFISWYNFRLYKLRKFFVMLTSSAFLGLDEYMSTRGFSDCSIHRYLKLITKYPLYQKIPVSKNLLSTFLKIKDRKIEYHLKNFENHNLLSRSYETSDIGQRKIGNSLYIELTPPSVVFNSLVTFKARFVQIDQSKSRASVLVKDVFGIYGDREIYMKRYLLDYTKENAIFMDGLIDGDQIKFLAIPDLYKYDKEQGTWFLHNAQEFQEI